ncbi:hypothetical protein FRB94_011464 [Tulasnella sp. JGI-2019a]|nr:hypothetical protein FRB94_011464 [Tulasnella sp. JGI-2019a]
MRTMLVHCFLAAGSALAAPFPHFDNGNFAFGQFHERRTPVNTEELLQGLRNLRSSDSIIRSPEQIARAEVRIAEQKAMLGNKLFDIHDFMRNAKIPDAAMQKSEEAASVLAKAPEGYEWADMGKRDEWDEPIMELRKMVQDPPVPQHSPPIPIRQKGA